MWFPNVVSHIIIGVIIASVESATLWLPPCPFVHQQEPGGCCSLLSSCRLIAFKWCHPSGPQALVWHELCPPAPLCLNVVTPPAPVWHELCPCAPLWHNDDHLSCSSLCSLNLGGCCSPLSCCHLITQVTCSQDRFSCYVFCMLTNKQIEIQNANQLNQPTPAKSIPSHLKVGWENRLPPTPQNEVSCLV